MKELLHRPLPIALPVLSEDLGEPSPYRRGVLTFLPRRPRPIAPGERPHTDERD